MTAPMDIESFIEAAGVSRETALRFDAWRVLLEKWSARINLVGGSTPGDFWRRHAYDSAQAYDVASDIIPRSDKEGSGPARWADLGSGAGFPGLAVALKMADAGAAGEVHLIEASAKRAAFLREAVRETGAPAIIREAKIEDLKGETFEVITARACAPLTRLLGYAQCLWKENTVGVFLKGREAEAELTAAGKSWRLSFETQPSRSDPNGRVVLIKRLEHADNRT